MHAEVRRFAITVVAALFSFSAAKATVIPALSFEELADSSDYVVAGKVTRSWVAWDSSHKYIWTHYEISVNSAQKGEPNSVLDIAEPGGSLDGAMMNIAGAVTYTIGDRVVLFLARMPNGYLRTSGWAQGKYTLDQNDRLHPSAASGVEMVNARSASRTATSLRSLEGMTLSGLKTRISARPRVAQNPGRAQ